MGEVVVSISKEDRLTPSDFRIETARLVLHEFDMSYLWNLYAIRSDPRVYTYETIGPFPDIDDTRKFIRTVIDKRRARLRVNYDFIISGRDAEEEAIGMCFIRVDK